MAIYLLVRLSINAKNLEFLFMKKMCKKSILDPIMLFYGIICKYFIYFLLLAPILSVFAWQISLFFLFEDSSFEEIHPLYYNFLIILSAYFLIGGITIAIKQSFLQNKLFIFHCCITLSLVLQAIYLIVFLICE